MAELALGVLGVVPLGGLVIQSYKKAFTRLKTFKHYDHEATRIQQELDLQWQFFKNDWKILLRLVYMYTGTSTSRTAGPSGSSAPGDYADAELDMRIRVTLGESHESYRYLVERIAKSLEGLETEMQGIHLLGAGQEDEASDTVKKVRRVQDGIRVMRKSAKFSDAIDELKASTSQLMKLREQLERLALPHSQNHFQKAEKKKPAAKPHAWKCNRLEHEQHLLKLFIGSEKTQAQLTMKLGIIYTLKQTFQPTLAQLEVRSEALQWRESPPRSLEDEGDRALKRLRMPTGISTEVSDMTLVPESNGTTQRTQVASPPKSPNSNDLRSSEDICLSLTCAPGTHQQRRSSSQSWARNSIYLGYLDGHCREGFRHTFYSDTDYNRAIFRSNHEPTPVDDMLGNTLGDRVSRIDKLRLARYLTMTVLKFHSTPWLGDVWQLRDLSMFVGDIEDLSQCLDTLHLNIDLARPQIAQQDDATGSLFQTVSSPRLAPRTEDEILCNIKNRPLYSLGVALLQIDRWTSLDMWNVIAVRNAADAPSQISEKFRYLTERCLECNFGPRCSKTLADQKLQKAVFKYVISELDVLVSLTEKMDWFESTDEEERNSFSDHDVM